MLFKGIQKCEDNGGYFLVVINDWRVIIDKQYCRIRNVYFFLMYRIFVYIELFCLKRYSVYFSFR